MIFLGWSLDGRKNWLFGIAWQWQLHWLRPSPERSYRHIAFGPFVFSGPYSFAFFQEPK